MAVSSTKIWVRKLLWNRFRDTILNIKGFRNNTIHTEDAFLDLFIDIFARDKAVLGIRELHNLYRLVRQVESVEGDVAEVGVYKGGSARVIAEAKGSKPLRLFDTFEGMPEVDRRVDTHRKGDFGDTSLISVKEYLRAYPNVFFYKGRFPESVEPVAASLPCFSFVNLDVDLYESTMSGLRFFYPRLNKGGILVSHDYRAISCPGVRKAVDEFFSDKPENVIQLWDTQCMIVKA